MYVAVFPYRPGISRIGTYITLDILLRQGSEDNIIDIIDTVVKLRSQRAYILNARVRLYSAANWSWQCMKNLGYRQVAEPYMKKKYTLL